MKELRTLLFQRALYNYHAVMYFKREIIISFFIITISDSDLYMAMIWLYLFLLDFLIPFLCGPDLQCRILNKMREIQLGSGGAINPRPGLALRSLLEPNYRVYQIRRRGRFKLFFFLPRSCSNSFLKGQPIVG